MSQTCFRCHGRKQISSYQSTLGVTYKACPMCKQTGQVSTDYIVCTKCYGKTFYETANMSGMSPYRHNCFECDMTGMIKTPEAIQREKQLADQQAKQEAEKKIVAERIKEEQDRTKQANLIIKQKNQEIAALKQKEATLLQKIQENQATIAQMERLGQQHQKNYIQLLQITMTLQQELILLKSAK